MMFTDFYFFIYMMNYNDPQINDSDCNQNKTYYDGSGHIVARFF